jgi:hypothetical protein
MSNVISICYKPDSFKIGIVNFLTGIGFLKSRIVRWIFGINLPSITAKIVNYIKENPQELDPIKVDFVTLLNKKWKVAKSETFIKQIKASQSEKDFGVKDGKCSLKQIAQISPYKQHPKSPSEQESPLCFHQWTHLELGAANYGLEGINSKKAGHENQLQPLYKTIDQLINQHGPNGTIFLNDLKLEQCEFARGKLQNYIKSSYPNSAIRVGIVAKDYTLINIPDDLKVAELTSVHMKNPDIHQLESAVMDHNWIKKVLDSAKQFVIVTPFKDTVAAYLVKHGVKKEMERLRFEKPVQHDTFVYVNPDGKYRKEWEGNTFHINIRKPLLEESFTKDEMDARHKRKLEIKEHLEELPSKYYLRVKEQIVDNLDFPLIAAFSDKWRKKILDKDLFKIDFSALNAIDDLENLKVIEDLANTKFKTLKSCLKDFRKKKELINQNLSTTSDLVDSQVNFLILKRFYSKKSPVDLWGRLKLDEAYKLTFSDNEKFWKSLKSLRNIYLELSNLQKQLNNVQKRKDLASSVL